MNTKDGIDPWGGLNTCTKHYLENSSGGLMICGINWGGDPEDESDGEVIQSFFSDARAYKFPFRNRLARWFARWGHPLEQVAGREGGFERSIVQCNWLRDQSRSMGGRDTVREAVEQTDSFIDLLEQLQPKLILLCSRALGEALYSPTCLSKVERVLGHAEPTRFEKRDVRKTDGGFYRRFVVSTRIFANTQLVVLPHPTGSKGLSDEYMAAFQDVMEPILDNYVQSHSW